MSDLYREEILEHYHSPQNFGMLEHPDATSHQTNPFCGDDISIFLQLRGENINDIRFSGKGCAISIAAASILTEFAKNKTKKELTNMTDRHMLDMLEIPISEARKKCALLALSTLKDCL